MLEAFEAFDPGGDHLVDFALGVYRAASHSLADELVAGGEFGVLGRFGVDELADLVEAYPGVLQRFPHNNQRQEAGHGLLDAAVRIRRQIRQGVHGDRGDGGIHRDGKRLRTGFDRLGNGHDKLPGLRGIGEWLGPSQRAGV